MIIASMSQQQQQRRKIIEWSPHHHNKFVVGDKDLRLYEIQFKNGHKSATDLRFSMDYPGDNLNNEESKTISLVSINSEVQSLKCLSWCPPGVSDQNLIAVGLTNGKAVLTSFSSVNRIAKEFVPKHSGPNRLCNAIAWNPFYQHQLAVGLDKVRGDCSALVWDVNQTGRDTSSGLDTAYTIGQMADNSFNITPQEAAEVVHQPMYELANSETTLALAWLPGSPSCLAAGTHVKWLRIYDLRGDINQPRSVVAHAKSVSGVCFDYFDYNRLATFSEDGIVKVWDIRKLTDPTVIVNTNARAIQQIGWCPTRKGVLATIFKEAGSNTIKLWDIKDTLETTAISPRNRLSGDASNCPVVAKPTKTHHASDSLSSFSWHPTNECRMLTVTFGGIVEVVSLSETIPLTWSPHGDLCFSFGTHLVVGPVASPDTLIHDSPAGRRVETTDISFLMKQRAQQGYSASIEDNNNLSTLFNDKGLRFLWSWASTINNIVPKSRADVPNKEFPGVYAVLHTTASSADAFKEAADETGIDRAGFFPVYKSPQRNTCQQICGWGFTTKASFEAAVSKLEHEQHYERAAALAVFHLNIRRAVAVLNKGCNSNCNTDVDKEREFNLRLAAMALAGFSENHAPSPADAANVLWRETCAGMGFGAQQYKHPYLVACFAFLNGDIYGVLDNKHISLADRIALSCRFLTNSDLLVYIERVQQSVIDSGDIEGVLITGLSAKGADLFQRYVDYSGDVQTACLAMIHASPHITKEPRVYRWICAYRELLDDWQLWHERALLDVRRGGAGMDDPRPQVFARCSFCNQSLSLNMIVPGSTGRAIKSIGGYSSKSEPPSTKHRINSCPNCKKPLPRCALCLLPLNCALPSFDKRTDDEEEQETGYWKSGANSFDNWFSWCQTCRHGGHAKHMLDWFATHIECPVTDCRCKCSTL